MRAFIRTIGRLGGRLYPLLLSLPLLAGAAVSLWLIAIDPLDRRPWGAPPRLADINYPSIVVPAQIRREQTVLLVGTSVALGVSAKQLRQSFGVKHAANLSYAKPFPTDISVMLHSAIKAQGVKRIIIEVGHTWLLGDRAPEQPGRRMLSAMNTNWFGLPEFDASVILATRNQSKGKSLSIPEWEKTDALYAPVAPAILPQFQRDRMRKAARERDMAAYHLPPASADCNRFPQLQRNLSLALKEAGARGILVDVYFPPIAFSAYPLMQETIGTSLQDRNLFQTLLQEQRCAVALVEADKRVDAMVHQVSILPAIVGDEIGLRDPFHYGGTAKFDLFLAAIRVRHDPLTSANFNAYQQSLSQAITAAMAAQRKETQ